MFSTFVLLPYSPFTTPHSSMLALMLTNRLCLRNKLTSVFSIVISPTVYFRNFTWPVTVTWVNWRSPFNGIRMPWVHRGPTATENTVNEVEQEHELANESQNSCRTDKHVQVREFRESFESRERIITAWETSNTNVVHWQEYQVNTQES